MKKLALVALVSLLTLVPVDAQQRPPLTIISDIEKLFAELKASLTAPLVITVPPGGNLQSVLDATVGGERIVLTAGATYGALRLPARSKPVVITTSAVLPERRITPADAALLPTIVAGGPVAAIDATGGSNWILDGVNVIPRPDGLGEGIVLQDSTNIVLRRVLLVAGVNGLKRGVRLNGQQVVVTQSYLANIWRTGQDSQALCGWDGAGPFMITDNFLEAGSENIMFGGADNRGPDYNPSDILIEGNTLSKNLAWKGKWGYAVKNLLELKNATRVVIRNNLLEHNWTDGQNGYGLLVKVANQDGRAPWSVTQDVLIEGNVLRDTENGINILGTDYQYPSGTVDRLLIRRNLIETPGTAIQLSGGKSITFDHNTFKNGYTFMSLYGLKTENLVVTNNLGNHNDYGVKGDSTGIGISALVAFTLQYTFSQNVLLNRVPGRGGSYPADNWFNLADVPVGITYGR